MITFYIIFAPSNNKKKRNMVTTFKVHKHVKNLTYVFEYWDGIPVSEYEVLAPYKGGNLKIFIDKNPVIRRPLFYGLKEFIRLNY